MTDEAVKWLCILACIFTVCLSGSSSYEKYLDAEVVKTGVNPMDIACAKGLESRQVVCSLYMERAKK